MKKITNQFGFVFLFLGSLAIQAMEEVKSKPEDKTEFDETDRVLFPPQIILELNATDLRKKQFIAFTHDGTRLFLPHGKWGAVLWDISKGKMDVCFHDIKVALIRTAYLSRDDKWLLLVSGGVVQLFSTDTGKPVKLMKENTSSAVAAEFSADGKQVLAAYNCGRAMLWDIETEKILAIFKSDRPLKRAHFSSNEKRIVAISLSGSVWVWNIGTKKPIPFSLTDPDIKDAWLNKKGDGLVVSSRHIPGFRSVCLKTARTLWRTEDTAQIGETEGSTLVAEAIRERLFLKNEEMEAIPVGPNWNISNASCPESFWLNFDKQIGVIKRGDVVRVTDHSKLYFRGASIHHMALSSDGMQLLCIREDSLIVYNLSAKLFLELTEEQSREIKKIIEFLKGKKNRNKKPCWQEYLDTLSRKEQKEDKKIFRSLSKEKRELLNGAFSS